MPVHNIPPVWDENSRILILGSFPSVKSREQAFFYAHPQNRFWRLLSELFASPMPVTTDEKKRLLLSNGVALWDVVKKCDIRGSSDSSLRHALPNDISSLLKRTNITRVYANGSTAYGLYNRLCLKDTGIQAQRLPSTSPANMKCSFDELLRIWSVIK